MKVKKNYYIPRNNPRGRPKGAYKDREVLDGNTIYVRKTGSNHKILRFHNRLKVDPSTLTEDTFTHNARRHHRGRYAKILKPEIELLESSSELERVEAEFEAKKYMYKILSYAKEDTLTPEELRKAKLFHYFSTKGVSNGYAANRTKKLLSADVFYILLCERPVEMLAEIFGVSPSVISGIKTGKQYQYEHSLVQSIRSIVRKNLRRLRPNGEDKVKRSVFRLCKRKEDGSGLEILYFCKSKQVAQGIRKTIIKESEFKRLTKKKLLEESYPIDEIFLTDLK